ncbi:MAG: hypothetical protein II453_03035 [Alphaproteobacteria bacterium]|nr:hypothetical protein [Alphaproteobacteria bacterium]
MFNLLKSALNIIPKQTVYYRKFISRKPNTLGNMVNKYGAKKTTVGSIQPIGKDTLYKLGIADTGDLYVIYLHGNIVGANKIASNDQIIDAKGNYYNVIRTDVWFDYPNQDWNKIIVRRVKNYD